MQVNTDKILANTFRSNNNWKKSCTLNIRMYYIIHIRLSYDTLHANTTTHLSADIGAEAAELLELLDDIFFLFFLFNTSAAWHAPYLNL